MRVRERTPSRGNSRGKGPEVRGSAGAAERRHPEWSMMNQGRMCEVRK